ncbi:MAG: NTP transferase domain-containing protein [Verrucomicrobia bacterium]|nr:NTP transferase domain-containing protein [Verrucomicrobiota bacterium]
MTDAFVLGAGLGTRLRPLTDELPKPLVPIFGKPLISFGFDHLINAGVQRLIVNTHRLPGKFGQVFPDPVYRGHRITFVHEPVLLGTGGGLRNAERHFESESVIVYSGDILTDFDLAPLLEEHARTGNAVTLALRQTEFAPSINLHSNRVEKIGDGAEYDFANVSVWTRKAIEWIPAGKPMSFIPVLQQAIADGRAIGGVVVNDGNWFNIGSASQYLAVHGKVARENWRPAYLDKAERWPEMVGAGASVDPGTTLSGFYSIGTACRVEAGASVTDSVLWPGARIAAESTLRNCVVRSGKIAEGTLENAVV